MSKNQAESSTALSFASAFDHYSFLVILAGDVCFVNLFRSILPVVPTECDVLIVGNIMAIIVHFTIEHQVYYDWKFKEQHAKIRENIGGGEKILSPRWFQHYGGERPVAPSIPTPFPHTALFWQRRPLT